MIFAEAVNVVTMIVALACSLTGFTIPFHIRGCSQHAYSDRDGIWRHVTPCANGDATRSTDPGFSPFERNPIAAEQQHRRSTANAVWVEEAARKHKLTVERMSGAYLNTTAGTASLDEMVELSVGNMRCTPSIAWRTACRHTALRLLAALTSSALDLSPCLSVHLSLLTKAFRRSAARVAAFATQERPVSQTEHNFRRPTMHIIALRDQSSKALVAFAAYRLDCWVVQGWDDDKPNAYLYELQLVESVRGATPSLGKALIAEVEEHAAYVGCRQLMFSVAESNENAIGFYDKGCGYESVSQRDETGNDGTIVSILEYAKVTTSPAYIEPEPEYAAAGS